MKAVKAILVAATLAASLGLNAADKIKDKDKDKPGSKVADSGSFGVFLNGKRVGTETFNITETLDGQKHLEYSTANAEISVATSFSGRSAHSVPISPGSGFPLGKWLRSMPL